MASPAKITGANLIMKAPKGEEDRVSDLATFVTRGGMISRWELSEDELQEIVRTGSIYLFISGHAMPPVYIATEKQMRAFSLDYGSPLPEQTP